MIINTVQLSISATSTEKLTRTVTWLRRLRSIIELFNRCLGVSDDYNEARLAMADVFGNCCARLRLRNTNVILSDFMLSILVDSVRHLRNCPTGMLSSKQSNQRRNLLVSREQMSRLAASGRS